MHQAVREGVVEIFRVDHTRAQPLRLAKLGQRCRRFREPRPPPARRCHDRQLGHFVQGTPVDHTRTTDGRFKSALRPIENHIARRRPATCKQRLPAPLPVRHHAHIGQRYRLSRVRHLPHRQILCRETTRRNHRALPARALQHALLRRVISRVVHCRGQQHKIVNDLRTARILNSQLNRPVRHRARRHNIVKRHRLLTRPPL